jgi:hypothetical protein
MILHAQSILTAMLNAAVHVLLHWAFVKRKSYRKQLSDKDNADDSDCSPPAAENENIAHPPIRISSR